MTHRQVGKGNAVCLNTLFDHNRIGVVLAAHGVKPPVRIENSVAEFSPGAWMPGLEVSRFADGEARYIGLTRRTGQPDGSMMLEFGESRELYDIRAGSHLGRRDTLQTSLGASNVSLYALLPYRVGGMNVDLPGKRHAPGQPITGQIVLDTGGHKPVRHIINLQVTRPDGQTVEYLSQNVETKTGRAHFEIPLCLNEPDGKWQIRFVDVATGTDKVVEVRVLKE